MQGQDYYNNFSASPKVVSSKPKYKYKDPYGQENNYVPQNIMFDKRIYRGTAQGAKVISSHSKPEDINMHERRERQRMAKRRQQEAAEQYTRREIPTPEPISGRQNLDVQTDQFVEELTDKAPCYDIGIQWNEKQSPRNIDFSIPTKTGTDFCAQTEDGDLFIFDDEVELILQVLCGKTLEHSKMEVLEEKELKYMREEQKHFQKLREDEIAEAQKLEAIELRKKQEIERRKQQHKVKKLERIAAHKKFTCRQVAKKFFAPLTSHALVSLKERGAMTNKFNSQLHEELVPWLFEKTNEFLIEDELENNNCDKILLDIMKIEQLGHRSMIDKEHQRLEDERIKAEKAHELKLYEKEKRRLNRQLIRREEELRKLKKTLKKNSSLLESLLKVLSPKKFPHLIRIL